MKNHSIILLAAGSSSRFGSPKQLAEVGGKSFVRHAISEAGKVAADIIVVLGANAELIQKEIGDLPVKIVFNHEWQEGMSSSIRCGLSAALSGNASLETVIIAVCDQPYLSAAIVKKLIEKHDQVKKHIVACSYNDTIGTPVLFDKTFFSSLLNLEGPAGAKKIISENKEQREIVSFPAGSIDIDTQDDYDDLLNFKDKTS